MVPSLRQDFNEYFTEKKYEELKQYLNEGWLFPAAFRIAETPVFFDDTFKEQLIAAGESILDTLLREDFKELTERAIPDKWRVPNENDHPHFLAFDFAVAEENGNMVPRLIELQGFPSLYAFQSFQGEAYKLFFHAIPREVNVYFSGLNQNSYIELMRRTIVGDCKPSEVILLDIDAIHQKTGIDFFVTNHYLGIPIIALEDLKQDGKKLYYEMGTKKYHVKRIYNRIIFDELEQKQEQLKDCVDLRQDLDVEWVTHPNWFYRISKFTMPYLEGDFVPQTTFLHELKEVPEDLENYVLKPLFSFAGQGVIIDVTREDIDNITDPENWILQKKITYAPAVQTPEGGVKCEIRLLYLWPNGDARPTLAINLMRMSRGKMIGVRYNKDFNWVGGTVGLFSQTTQSSEGKI